LQISAQNSRANAMIALKFVANMFAQPALASVASKNDVMILNALMSLSVQQTVSEQQIRLPIANIVLKCQNLALNFSELPVDLPSFSSILCEETVMTEGKQCALRLIAQVRYSSWFDATILFVCLFICLFKSLAVTCGRNKSRHTLSLACGLGHAGTASYSLLFHLQA